MTRKAPGTRGCSRWQRHHQPVQGARVHGSPPGHRLTSLSKLIISLKGWRANLEAVSGPLALRSPPNHGFTSPGNVPLDFPQMMGPGLCPHTSLGRGIARREHSPECSCTPPSCKEEERVSASPTKLTDEGT